MKYSKIAASTLCALAMAMVFVIGPASARSNTAIPTGPQASQQQPSQQQQMQTFTGTIVSSQNGYVLDVAGKSYTLDNQTDAAKFVGKQVKVTGKLDSSTNTIQVSSIEPASS